MKQLLLIFLFLMYFTNSKAQEAIIDTLNNSINGITIGDNFSKYANVLSPIKGGEQVIKSNKQIAYLYNVPINIAGIDLKTNVICFDDTLLVWYSFSRSYIKHIDRTNSKQAKSDHKKLKEYLETILNTPGSDTTYYKNKISIYKAYEWRKNNILYKLTYQENFSKKTQSITLDVLKNDH